MTMRAFGVALAAVCLAATGVASADDFEVSATEAAPPSGVADAVAEAVGAGSLLVSRSGEPSLELWLREDLPVSDAAEVLEVSFPGLAQGELLGVVRVAGEWKEYKGLAVGPGVYTMRYARRPSDGNHMGVSMFKDFALLTPAGSDPEVDAGWSEDELNAKSMEATGQPHPASLALFPVWDAVDGPTLMENDMGQPMLAVPLGSLQLGLTLEGQGTH